MTTYIDSKAVGVGTIRAEIGVTGVVLHDNTLVGNGNTEPLGVNTENIVSQQTLANTISVLNTAIDAQAEAIQKTREDYIQADSEIHQILNNHAENLTTLHNDVDDLGDQVAEIESKIPESANATNPLVTKEDLKSIDLEGYATTEYVNAREQEIRDDVNQVDSELQSQITAQASAITSNTTSINDVKAVIPDGTSDTNPLINKQQLLDEEMDIRSDLIDIQGELQTQITAQATEIAKKQDKLTAGDNITIEDGVISATGGGAGGDFLPLSGGTMTGVINFDYNSGTYGNENLITFSAYNGSLNIIRTGQGGAGLVFDLVPSTGSTKRRFRLSTSGFHPDNTNGECQLGSGSNRWGTVFATHLSSTSGYGEPNKLIIPDKAGTLVVATPPTEDGSYVLKCVITNGVPTVSWVKE